MSSCLTSRRVTVGACFTVTVTGLALASALAAAAPAEPEAAPGQRIAEVVVRGNRRVSSHVILGQMRLREGSVYTPEAVDEDLKRIYELGEFDNVVLRPEQRGDRLVLVVEVTERPILKAIEFVGNDHFSDEKLIEAVGIAAGGLMDRHRLFTGVRAIEQKYRDAGYHFVGVELDEDRLAREQVARYTLAEGPKVRLSKIQFVGNPSIPAMELKSKMQTTAWFPIISAGIYDEQQLQRDLANIRNHYLDEGFLDVSVGRELDFNPKQTRLTVRIIIDEGPRYEVRSVTLEGVDRFSRSLLKKQMLTRPGQAYTAERVRRDLELIQETYGEVGYIDTFVRPVTDFGPEPGIVDVRFLVEEREPVHVGRIRIEGNTSTQDKVVRRALRFYPGEPVNTKLMDRAKRRLEGMGIFKPGSVRVATIPTGEPDVRDIVVRVEETDTATLILGAGISSNTGVLGNLSLVQRNFDIADPPDSWDELAKGEAWRGAGQLFQLVLEPGSELQRYRIDFREPSLFDSDVSLTTSGFYFERERDRYDERRLGGSLGFGQELVEDLHLFLTFRYENIDIRDLSFASPTDLVAVAGQSELTSVEVGLVHDTTDSFFFPTEGVRVRGSVEQGGALGGDHDFTKVQLDARRYWTVTRDVLDRRSVLAVRGHLGYAFNDPPIFERFYAGGIHSIRGFEFRGIGPHELGTSVGGDFLALASAEYSFPVLEKSLTGLVFVDMGTVEEDFDLTTWRVSAGFGIRFTVPFFGPVPFAFNFGFPLVKDDEDEEETFSFSIGTSF